MDEKVKTPAVDDIAVYELHCGTGDGADMVFAFNGCLISVSVFPSNGSSTNDTQGQPDRPLQDNIIGLIEKATTCRDHDQYEELVDEVLAVILDAERPLFSQMITSQDEQTLKKTLHDFLFPPFFHFRLEAPTPTGGVKIKPISSGETNTIYTTDPASYQDFQDGLDICQDLPGYTPEEVVVTEAFAFGADSITAAVQVRGRDMFCKSRGRAGELHGTSEARELKCLGEMLKVFPPRAINVPQLLGYVNHKDTHQILGFLRQLVPGSRLSDVIEGATADKRQKWACQIRHSIELLHQNGLVWGDGKASNIIIDDKDDAWLINFGGGYTRGWTDEELAETKEGDEQALERIIELLSGGEDEFSVS